VHRSIVFLILHLSESVNQTWKGIRKAWLGYTIAKNKGEDDRMVYAAEVIQKLRKELDLPPAIFPHLDIDIDITKEKKEKSNRKKNSENDNNHKKNPEFTDLLQNNLNKRY
jgi:hypothetical protein